MPTIPRGGPQYTHTWGPGDDPLTQKLVISGRTSHNCTEEALFLFVRHIEQETRRQLGIRYGISIPIVSRHLDRGPVTRHHERYTFTTIFGLPGHPACLDYYTTDSDDGPYGHSPEHDR
jgi:hypothetical protein